MKRFPSRYDSGALGWLHDHSYLFRLANKHALRLVGRLEKFGQKGPAGFSGDSDIYLKPAEPPTQAVISINAKLLEGFVSSYAARGIPVVMLAVPTKCELGRCFGMKSPNENSRKAFRAAIGNLPVTIVDPTDTFKIEDFWSEDAHWRPSGHRKIADALLPVLLKQLELGETAPR